MSRFSQTTPGTYSIRVPCGTTRIIVDVAGSESAVSTMGGPGTNGTTGKGGRVQATLRVRSGEQLTIVIPSQGTGQSGGVESGSGNHAGAGGDKATITGSLSGTLVIAGGGGGPGGRGTSNGNGGNGGAGGGTTAGNGADGTAGANLGHGGQGATGAANGAGGTGGPGTDGTAGGPGAGCATGGGPGGGGGNGFFTGGGGEANSIDASNGGGGGGGGSSFTHATQTQSATHTQGFQSGAGYAVLDFLDYAPYTDRYRFLR